jgi:hypothetical protein
LAPSIDHDGIGRTGYGIKADLGTIVATTRIVIITNQLTGSIRVPDGQDGIKVGSAVTGVDLMHPGDSWSPEVTDIIAGIGTIVTIKAAYREVVRLADIVTVGCSCSPNHGTAVAVGFTTIRRLVANLARRTRIATVATTTGRTSVRTIAVETIITRVSVVAVPTTSIATGVVGAGITVVTVGIYRAARGGWGDVQYKISGTSHPESIDHDDIGRTGLSIEVDLGTIVAATAIIVVTDQLAGAGFVPNSQDGVILGDTVTGVDLMYPGYTRSPQVTHIIAVIRTVITIIAADRPIIRLTDIVARGRARRSNHRTTIVAGRTAVRRFETNLAARTRITGMDTASIGTGFRAVAV